MHANAATATAPRIVAPSCGCPTPAASQVVHGIGRPAVSALTGGGIEGARRVGFAGSRGDAKRIGEPVRRRAGTTCENPHEYGPGSAPAQPRETPARPNRLAYRL